MARVSPNSSHFFTFSDGMSPSITDSQVTSVSFDMTSSFFSFSSANSSSGASVSYTFNVTMDSPVAFSGFSFSSTFSVFFTVSSAWVSSSSRAD
jgi:hypothetical protein